MTGAVLRTACGSVLALDVPTWTAPVGVEDLAVLDRARAPVLDVGCGPGRHSLALAERAMVVLGIDVSPAAVSLARAKGAPVLLRSVFESVPGAGRWRTALLLDGNIGISGDPPALLGRLAQLVTPGGTVLVEVQPPGTESRRVRARVEHENVVSPWFSWATVGADDVDQLAESAGLAPVDVWGAGARWFAELAR